MRTRANGSIGPIVLALAIAAAPTAAVHAQSYYAYQCKDGEQFEVVFYPDRKAAYVQVDGKSLILPKRLSVVGARYSKNGVTLSVRGDNATYQRVGKKSQCVLAR